MSNQVTRIEIEKAVNFISLQTTPLDILESEVISLIILVE